jgi:hypothetical protein
MTEKQTPPPAADTERGTRKSAETTATAATDRPPPRLGRENPGYVGFFRTSK